MTDGAQIELEKRRVKEEYQKQEQTEKTEEDAAFLFSPWSPKATTNGPESHELRSSVFV
jgi:hypothetical protein